MKVAIKKDTIPRFEMLLNNMRQQKVIKDLSFIILAVFRQSV